MTSRERILAALRHCEPDRTPIFEYVMLPAMSDALLGVVAPQFGDDEGARWQWLEERYGWEGALRHDVEVRLDLAELLGHDMLYVTPYPLPTGQRALEAPSPELQGDDPVARVLSRTLHAESLPVTPAGDSLLVYHIFRERMAARGCDYPILAPAYAHGVWTDVDLMQTMLLEPDVAHRHFALATRRAGAAIDAFHALGVEQVGIGGDFAGNRPLISPQAYREFIMPEVRALARAIHQNGQWAVNASDGDLWPVIDDFLLGCEVDGYLEIDAHAGMDLRKLKAEFGARITLYGNIDCGNTMSYATPEEIRAAVIDCLEAGQGQGGHIFCVSNAITSSVPVRNYLTLVNAYREFFALPEIKLAG